MDPLITVALIAAVPAMLSAMIAAVSLGVSIHNSGKLKKVSEDVDGRFTETNKQLATANVKLTQVRETLVTQTGRAERAEGREEGADKERAAASGVPALVVPVGPHENVAARVAEENGKDASGGRGLPDSASLVIENQIVEAKVATQKPADEAPPDEPPAT